MAAVNWKLKAKSSQELLPGAIQQDAWQVLPQRGGAWVWPCFGSCWLRGTINQRSERRKMIDNHRDSANKNYPYS
jgi:hypothetical protein